MLRKEPFIIFILAKLFGAMLIHVTGRGLRCGHATAFHFEPVLNCRNVDYFNAKGSFVDAHTVEATSQDGKKVCCSDTFQQNVCVCTCTCTCTLQPLIPGPAFNVTCRKTRRTGIGIHVNNVAMT